MAYITTVQETSWSEIQEAVNQGKASAFRIGQVVTDTLKNGKQMPFVLAAINHYQPDELIFVNDISFGEYSFHRPELLLQVWRESDLRKHANTKIFQNLPDELQEIISPRFIEEPAHESLHRVVPYEGDKLWVPSVKELFGNAHFGDAGDKQMSYFRSWESRRMRDNRDYYEPYWTRTSRWEPPTRFLFVVNRDGETQESESAEQPLDVRLAFCIRKKERKIC